MLTFQQIFAKLSDFWAQQGCTIHQGYDLELGAGTFNPTTFLRCLGPEPYRAAYVEPSRRPKDGRYGENPNRLQHYFQYQVIFKPSPPDIQDLYIKSLEAIGLDLDSHDIRFVHDDWEAPTQGAWGLGWEVWLDGMEVSQFTYFQCFGGIPVKPVTAEITYGLERLAMYLQKVDHYSKIQWDENVTYGDIYTRNEFEGSHYNFTQADVAMWFRHFDDFEREARRIIGCNLPIPAYDFVIKASHAFNILDARGVISTTERTGYIARIRELSKAIAEAYIKSREEQGFPLLRLNREEKTPVRHEVSSPLFANYDASEHDDFLLEIGSEELPATFVPIGCSHLERALKQLLQAEEISFASLQTFGTPRRLAVLVKGMALGKAPKTTERRGPPVNSAFDANGKPTVVGEGFFKAINQPACLLQDLRNHQVSGLSIRTIKDIDYLFADVQTPGAAAAKILADNLPKLILGLEFPKTMRWGNLDITYARPLRWITALIGKEIIPFTVGLIDSGRESWGHRQLAPGPFAIERASDYLSALKSRHVMADIQERTRSILEQLESIARSENGVILAKEKVIPQVLNLVEWPMLTAASFDPAYLRAPREVLISEMVEHQKYFPMGNTDGSLKNIFIITANNTPSDQIREGNIKALSPRLADGVFLYEQDLKTPLEEFNNKLKQVTFQKDLGSVYDKVQRIKANVEILHPFLPISSIEKALRGAEICKTDLASELVGEFPELQGIIGRHYALSHGEDPEIAAAVDEHWMPRGENAPLPATGAGILVSFADKIDNLISCFAVNLKPTSSSDPYALRRQVLGIIKTLIKGGYQLPLPTVLDQCIQKHRLAAGQPNLAKEILEFITQRVKTVFLDDGFEKDEIEASLSQGIEDIYDSFCKVKALHAFRTSSDRFKLLFEVFKRAKGQLANQEKQSFHPEHLVEKDEILLNQALEKVEQELDKAVKASDYNQAYACLAELQPHLAGFFDNVKVLADDPLLRQNRIASLQRVFSLFSRLLDFSKIQERG